MINRFDVSARHTIVAANVNRFSKGIVHPSRIIDEHVFIYINEGNWKLCVKGTEYCTTKGDVLIFPAYQHHYGMESCADGTGTMYIHVKALPGDTCLDAMPNAKPDASPNNYYVNMHIKCQDRPTVKSLFEDIITVCLSQAPGWSFKASALLDLLIYELSHNEDAVGAADVDSLGNRALKIIYSHPERYLSLDELSRMLYVSKRTLSDEFKSCTGCGVHEYQMLQKLKMAAEQMRFNPKIPLEQIAASYGFYDEFHFSKQFKKHYGVSPSEYRKEYE